MLVQTRKPGEKLLIDGDIEVTVISIGSRQVKLGVQAPPGKRIDRMEVAERRKAEAEKAAA